VTVFLDPRLEIEGLESGHIDLPLSDESPRHHP